MGAPLRFPRSLRSVVAAALVLLGALGFPVGCSSSSSNGGNSPCGSSTCAAGTACVDEGSGQLGCHQVCTSSAQCGAGTYCNDGQPQSWCAPNTFSVPEAATGQFGTSCVPTAGEENNPACDSPDGFACYGISPTDATAFCTLFGCALDSDCPGSFWCATVNRGPNVVTGKATFGPTRRVCLPRAYCAPCQLDHDCPSAADGTAQHCIRDTGGNGFCSPVCGTDANCALDATCQNWQSLCGPAQGAACQSDDDCAPLHGVAQHCDASKCTPECASASDCAGVAGPDGGVPVTCEWHRVCTPRAGVCLGNGGFCSPCRSDADCPKGFCLSGMPYSTERFCSVKSTSLPCDTTTPNPTGCPPHVAASNWLANACTTSPPNQCEGLVVLGTSAGEAQEVPGCWTVNR